MVREATVFYSWQSDRPNSVCRGFIETTLERAIKLGNERIPHARLVLDQGARGSPGMPNIAETILSKIRRSAIFVGDLTLISDSRRFAPNPNVLLETGYALGTLGPERMIGIMNTEFGMPSDLPFDLGFRSMLCYQLADGTTPKHPVRDPLVQDVADALVLACPNFGPLGPDADSLPDPAESYPGAPDGPWDLPAVSLSKEQERWLELMADELETGQRTPTHVRVRQEPDIPRDFNPESISRALLTETGDITLLGLWRVNPETPWVERADRLLYFVKRIIEDDPTTATLQTAVLADKLGLTREQVSHLLHICPGKISRGASGNPSQSGHYLTTYGSFDVSRADVFAFYEGYAGIEKLLKQEFDNQRLRDARRRP